MFDQPADAGQPQITRVDVGDAELQVTSTGTGPAVILVAGLGGRGAFWHRQIGPLSQAYRVVIFDHRGCGASTRDRLTVDVAQLARDVIAMMDAMGITRASLIGHSTGGAIGQHLALDYPHRLDKMVLSSTWAGPDRYFVELFRLRRSILERCGPLDYLSAGTFLATPGARLQVEMQEARELMNDRLAAFPGMDVELSRIEAVIKHDLRSRLGEIGKEVLCICARDDQITPPGFTEELGHRIQGARMAILDEGGHFAPLTVSEVYNAHILEFLGGLKTDEVSS